MLKGTYCLILFTLLSLFIKAQSIIEPEMLTIEDGLSQGFISSVMQDREGFLWIGTKNGLNRYDGENFEKFTHDPADPFSISQDQVNTLYDYGNFILAGTSGGGLNLFHKQSKRFYTIPLEDKNRVSQNSEYVFFIHKDTLGQFWAVESSNNQIFRITFPKGFKNLEKLSEKDIESINSFLVPKDFKFLTDEMAYIGDYFLFLDPVENKINQLDIRTLEWAPFIPPSTLKEIERFKVISQKKLLAKPLSSSDITSNLAFFNGHQWQNIHFDFSVVDFLPFEKEQQPWLFLWGKEQLMFFDQQILDKPQISTKDASHIIKSNNLGNLNFTMDQSGILWQGTSGYGIMKFSPRLFKIKTHFRGKSIYRFPFMSSHNEIFFHNQITDENLYIPGEKPRLSLIHKGLKPKSKIIEVRNGDLWTLVQDTSHFYMSKLNKKGWFEKQHIIMPREPKGPIVKYIPQENTILAASNNYLVIFHIENKSTRLYRFRDQIEKTINVFSLEMTKNGLIWVGTSKGLIKIVPQNDSFESQFFTKEDGERESLLNNQVATLLKDPIDEEILWIGTRGGGLHRLDTRNMTFSYLNTKNGLPNDVIYGILNDDDGNLWMSSNKGLIRYNTSNGQIKNFTKADGLQSDEFNTYAYAKSLNGTMLFGGINGLNVFHPNDLKENPNAPEVWITGLQINNEKVTVRDSTHILEQAIEYTPKLTLPFSKNNLTFEFAGLEFSAPSKNRYRYYLEGAEAPWVHESTDNFAPYLNLSPGNYTFKIKGANGDGVWNKKITSLKIKILPPWYGSNLAYFLYLTILGLIIWWLFRLRLNRLRLKYEIENERKEAERQKELNTAKSHFFTNISHEFRTPLTIINGITEKMAENPEKWFHKGQKMIRRNSDNLLNLVNQILDLRKLESGDLKLNLIQRNIISYIKYIIESFQSYSEDKNIELKLDAPKAELIMDFDPDKILRIISNLMSNALKFTPEGGKITVKVSSITSSSSPFLCLQVIDTGVGIPKNKLPEIFNQFYQVDSSNTRQSEGTGIGLALTQELVHLMNGNIKVNSQLGEGTRFTITIPIHTEAPLKNIQNQISKSIDLPYTVSGYEEIEISNIHNSETKPSLLIVEDNSDVVQYLVSCLEDQYHLKIAMDGQEGIEKAIQFVPDIIISDLMMPRKDGLELCQALKTDERTSHIPIVLLTAKADQDSRLEGLTRGADEYLTKPFDKKELLLRLNNLLSIRKKLQERYSTVQHPKPSDDPTFQQEDEFILKVRKIIEANLDDENFGLLELCKEVTMSRSQLYRKIKALTNQSTSLYIRSVRLQNAKALLETTDLNIAQVAFETGFSNPSYFSRIFSEEFGFPPTKNRK